MKYVVYYRVRGGTTVNRAYPDYSPGVDVKGQWLADNLGTNRVYLQHEEHDVYTAEFANAGMVGASESSQRQWLERRVHDLNQQAMAAQQAQAGRAIPANYSYGAAPGSSTVDQNGRRGRVPNVPLEVFRTKPISPDTAMDAVRDFCKGGGGSIPRSS